MHTRFCPRIIFSTSSFLFYEFSTELTCWDEFNKLLYFRWWRSIDYDCGQYVYNLCPGFGVLRLNGGGVYIVHCRTIRWGRYDVTHIWSHTENCDADFGGQNRGAGKKTEPNHESRQCLATPYLTTTISQAEERAKVIRATGLFNDNICTSPLLQN